MPIVAALLRMGAVAPARTAPPGSTDWRRPHPRVQGGDGCRRWRGIRPRSHRDPPHRGQPPDDSAERDEASRGTAERAHRAAVCIDRSIGRGERLGARIDEPAMRGGTIAARTQERARASENPGWKGRHGCFSVMVVDDPSHRRDGRDGDGLAVTRLRHGSDNRCRRPRTGVPRAARTRSADRTGCSGRTCPGRSDSAPR